MFSSKPKVRVLKLHGTIGTQKREINIVKFGKLIDRAFDGMTKNDAVILWINSPGGSPTQSYAIADKIRTLAGRTATRVHALIEDVGASGGYWIACAADVIHANPFSLVGSIGVVAAGFGLTELIARHGIERRVYRSSHLKAANDPFAPEDPEAKQIMENLIHELHIDFTDWVKSRRRQINHITDVNTGRVWLGKTAMRLGLVDQINTLEALVVELGGELTDKNIIEPKIPFLDRLPILAAEALWSRLDAKISGPRLYHHT